MLPPEMIARARAVFDVEIEGLRRVRDSLGDAFAAAVRLISETLDAGGLVVVSGVGKSLHVAEKTSAIFASTGTRSIVLNPVQAMHGDLGMTAPNDVLLALSFSGESDEVVRLIPPIRRHGLKVIAMTGNPDSSLARMADVVLETPCGPEACPFGMAPTNSATAMMAMGDALAMTLVDHRRFDVKRYAANHPAGAIGRALVLKVADVMRPLERVAAVRPETTVLDSLLAMTNHQAGSAAVVSADGKLLGIFTDGDFRRHVAEGRSVLSDEVGRHMTANPSTIGVDAYAAELLKVFETRRIDDLPVVDSAGVLVGMVDLQDLPKMKVL